MSGPRLGWLSRLLPATLLGRSIALLVALLTLTQLGSLVVLLHYVQRPRVEGAAAVFAHYVVTLDTALAAMPADAARATLTRLGGQPVQPAANGTTGQPFRDWQREAFLNALRRQLPPTTAVRWQSEQGQPDHRARLWIGVHVDGQAWWLPMPLTEEDHALGFFTASAWFAALACIAVLAGLLLQRYLNRPLRQLAGAAVAIATGKPPPRLRVDGPREIAQVSAAFNGMSEALQQAETTRALMLAGVSHDIRTPLTKMRLAMAMNAPPGASDMAWAERYLDQIDTILQQFMDYAGSGEGETPQWGDLNALLAELAGGFAGLGHAFALSLGEIPLVRYRPASMMRLLMNLMQNAVNYGKTGLAARTWAEPGAPQAPARVCIAIGDRGSGLDVGTLEGLRSPFARGADAARQASGTGLGLAIVDRIARRHGGTLRFQPRKGGGIEAVVSLPVEPA